jgi:hypothetical protein
MSVRGSYPPEIRAGLRSLLQKAVRRGHGSVAVAAADALTATGDRAWVQRRATVILFEESWQLAVRPLKPFPELLALAAHAVKEKDAAGLGTLGLTLAGGDATVLVGLDSAASRQVRIIAEAVRRPNDFWRWVADAAVTPEQQNVVTIARAAHRGRHWPWDHAFMQAAAYLAIISECPSSPRVTQTAVELPFWVAFDRHTPQGRRVLAETARTLKASSKHLAWASFYFEGAQVNELVPGIWWEHEVSWRLRSIGIDTSEAARLWDRARPVVEKRLAPEAASLAEILRSTLPRLHSSAS